jgi:hypothetical protein
VSISSLQSNNWIPPYLPQSSQTSTSSATRTNPFQQLAADVQTVLAQGQSVTTRPASDPTQQLATDLQSIHALTSPDGRLDAGVKGLCEFLVRHLVHWSDHMTLLLEPVALVPDRHPIGSTA